MSSKIEAIVYDNIPLRNGQQDVLVHIRKLEARNAELLGALKNLFEQCEMVHKYWGDGNNAKQADDAIAAARAAIQKVKGE